MEHSTANRATNLTHKAPRKTSATTYRFILETGERSRPYKTWFNPITCSESVKNVVYLNCFRTGFFISFFVQTYWCTCRMRTRSNFLPDVSHHRHFSAFFKRMHFQSEIWIRDHAINITVLLTLLLHTRLPGITTQKLLSVAHCRHAAMR